MVNAKIKLIYEQLDELFESAERLDCSGNSKFVVFSDLYMGDGSTKDDFRQNSELFRTALNGYYLTKDYHSNFHIPCLFNSGCIIGKRGLTCLEIDN